MKKLCPKKNCPNPKETIKKGTFLREHKTVKVQRYFCKSCGCNFSQATLSPHYRTRKRKLNTLIHKDLCSGNSEREITRKHHVSRGKVARRLKIFSQRAVKRQAKLLKGLSVKHFHFDDMISFEHRKMKPLSISLAVDAKTRVILGAVVSQIPANGKLALKSREKYGIRPSRHKQGLEELFEKISHTFENCQKASSDMHSLYPCVVKKYCGHVQHKRYKGRKAAVVGQGEMKVGSYDPLFYINHAAAMLRDNIKRLSRKTWCTTKKLENLQHLINVYIDAFNTRLLKN